MTLKELKESNEAPEWLNDEGFETISRGYLLPNETPKGMYTRIAKATAKHQKDSKKWEKKFFDVMWRNWLCCASPVLSNMGSNRGLPISCFSLHIDDSVRSIFDKNTELAILSKNGGGVGFYMGDIRGRGAGIAGVGKSEGIVPWCKVYDTTTQVISQGGVRRGASAAYLDIEHGDIDEFLNIRRPIGDQNRRCLNLNHGICISNKWMQEMIAGDTSKRLKWQEILKNRIETGEPYLFFKDNVNNQNPECYQKNNLHVSTSNICCLAADTEILTKTGIKKIKDLVGKTVEIWDGNEWIENSSFTNYGPDNIVRIWLVDGSYVDSNPKHRWFAASNYNNIREEKYKETITSELKEGQWLMSHSKSVEGSGGDRGLYLKGFLTGDGTHVNDRPLLFIYKPKYICINTLIESAKELTPGEINTNAITEISVSDETNYQEKGTFGDQSRVVMKGLSQFKLELFPWVTNVRSDGLPDEVFSWSRKSRIELLSGLLDSDGTMSKWSIQWSSKSQILIRSVQKLVKSLGYNASIDCFHRNDANRQDCWRISIGPWDGMRLASEWLCKRLKPEVDDKPANRKTTGWRKIKKIEHLTGKYDVFCPQVPSTKKFALANGLMTGNTEITLHTDPDHTFVCCLSSLNLAKYNDWKNTDLVSTSIRFLDGIMQEFIDKTENEYGFEASRQSAIKGRALGLGVLGWHTLLQDLEIPFDSFDSMQLNAEIFKKIRQESDKATLELGAEFGEPEWCKGTGRRNTHTIAIAPTVSNSAISGGVSAGIEPLPANIYAAKSAKGTFFRKNPNFLKLLQNLNKDTPEIWSKINEAGGSVQHLDFITPEQKQIFLTAREINQHAIIKQAAQRQRWVDQSQSVNLFFGTNSDPKYIHQVHIAAWELGLKTLYYLRAEGVIKGDSIYKNQDECVACGG
jgi:ribonucleoside-diphosphate reductase alpha chain